MDYALAKFVAAAQHFTSEDWDALLKAITDGDRKAVKELFGFTSAEAEIAFRGVRRLEH